MKNTFVERYMHELLVLLESIHQSVSKLVILKQTQDVLIDEMWPHRIVERSSRQFLEDNNGFLWNSFSKSMKLISTSTFDSFYIPIGKMTDMNNGVDILITTIVERTFIYFRCGK